MKDIYITKNAFVWIIGINVLVEINVVVWDNVNNVLNIIGLICCGIKKRLNYLEFEQMIRKYDIICLVETKTDDIDIVKLEGMKFIWKIERL